MSCKNIVLAFFIGIFISLPLRGDDAKKLPWETNIKEAFAHAQKSDKKVFMAYCAPWCVMCKKMEARVCGKKEIIAYLKKNFILIKIDVSQHPEIAENYKVTHLPTFIFMEPSGKEITRKHGYIYSDTFLQILHFVAKEKYKDMTLDEYID